MCRVTELRCKEVVNIKDGARLGFVDDVEIEITTGQVIAIIVYGASKFFGIFGRCEEYVIPWCDIEKIGNDIVLVCYELPMRISCPQKRGGFFSSLFK